MNVSVNVATRFPHDSPLRRLLGRHQIDLPPHRLSQRRLFILPTWLGLLYLALLAGLLIGSANYGISLGYLFTFLLGGLGTVTMFHTQRNLAGLHLSPGMAEPVFAGDDAHFPLGIENPSRLPRHAISARADGELAACDVAARDRTVMSIATRTARRGEHRLGRVTLSSTWPLGLFRCWTVFEFDWKVLVYPCPADVHLPLPKARDSGRARATEAPGDDSFSGLRGYRPGDSPRHIAWKAAARGLSLQTKVFTGQSDGTRWIDWHAAPEHGIEEKLSRLARWAIESEPDGTEWGLRLPDRVLPPGHGEAHLRACLEALARHGL